MTQPHCCIIFGNKICLNYRVQTNIESKSEHKSLFLASSSVMISLLTLSCLPYSFIFSCCCCVLITCLLTLSWIFLFVSNTCIGCKMLVFKLSMAVATDDFIVSWIRGAIISDRTGAILLLNVL